MKIPSKVNILGRNIKVVRQTSVEIQKEMGFKADGYLDWDKKTIFICKDLTPYEALITFYHETSHVAHYVVGLNQVLAPEMQEIISEVTANLIYDLTKGKKQ